MSFWLFDPTSPVTVTQTADDITLKGKVQGNDNLDLEVVRETVPRLEPDANDIIAHLIDKIDQANYILKITNRNKEQVKSLGLHGMLTPTLSPVTVHHLED